MDIYELPFSTNDDEIMDIMLYDYEEEQQRIDLFMKEKDDG